ncbi:flagellar FliJ protein [Paenibacillus anaericanus]|uniref:Flagellar FliJ protein n=1 Tax=Paenibacillus anaericanus TaxID=170367 RepID=A0A433YAJ5_9BACL|nr:flagellar export protein FliJ [Paenibacillus anaericanus]MDQ0090624.1 flagellar FliJ protein [Paenibacillus anaericanus]RUT46900.1 flagellar export protein FliJ [Paenibacillus anaericanus]
MRFRYVYQKVVDLKSNEKTQAEWMLSAAVGHLQSEQRSLDRLFEDKRATFSVIQSEMENKASVIKLQELQRYVDYLEQCITSKLRDVKRAEIHVENKKSFLNSKMLDEKVWLKAKEKEQDKFQHEMLLREQNELDEMATVRFAMRAR